MTIRMRNMIAPMWDYLGDTRVGLPSADIPPSSLMYAQAIIRPGDLVRLYAANIPNGTTIEEDGTYTGQAPSYWELYVNGVNVGAFGEEAVPKKPPITGPTGDSAFTQRTVILGDQVFKVRSQNQLNMLLNQFMGDLEQREQEDQPRRKVIVVQPVEVDEPSFIDWLSEQKH